MAPHPENVPDDAEEMYKKRELDYLKELKVRIDVGELTEAEAKALIPRKSKFGEAREQYIRNLNELYNDNPNEFYALASKVGTSDVFELAERLAIVAEDARIKKEIHEAAFVYGGNMALPRGSVF